MTYITTLLDRGVSHAIGDVLIGRILVIYYHLNLPLSVCEIELFFVAKFALG
jgi:hypothetical protein